MKRRMLVLLAVFVLMALVLAPVVYGQEPIELVELPPNPVPVDAVWSGTFDGETEASVQLLENPACYDFFGRRACVGQVLGEDVLVLTTGTQPLGAIQAITMLPYHFPPKGEKYIVFTHGGIAGGYHQAFVEGDPELQPGDSLAPDHVCAVGSFYIQPTRIRGWIEVKAGDSLYAITREITGDGSMWPELYELNEERLQLAEKGLQPGMVLMSPWENVVVDKRIPYGGSLYSADGRVRLSPADPCFELSPEAKALRDKTLEAMEVLPLPQSIVDYRAVNFIDARGVATVFSGYAEAGGWSWFASPVEARWQEEMWGVRMGDMESHTIAFGYFSQYPKPTVSDVETGYLVEEPEVDVLFLRTSSDPPDGYNGPAGSELDFQNDPIGTFNEMRGYYNLGIPFGDLIGYQSAQLAEFSYTALEQALAQ